MLSNPIQRDNLSIFSIEKGPQDERCQDSSHLSPSTSSSSSPSSQKIRIISIEFQHHQGSRAAGRFHRHPQRRANPTMVIIISSSSFSSSFSSSSSSSSSSSPSSSFSSSSSSSSSSTSTSSSHLEDLFRGKILVDAKLSTSTVGGLQK